LDSLWGQLAGELVSAEAQVESTASELLAGRADDAPFNQKSDRVAALEARISSVRKLAGASGTALQQRLQKDIAATEWLAQNWLAHRLLTETTKLLESVTPQKRDAVTEAATVLAEAGINYQASVSELGAPAPVSYAWTRPIEPVSEKSALSIRLINDPMFQPPPAEETIHNLIDAAKVQQARWSALLIAIGLEPGFQMPSYEEPKPEVWQPTKAEAGIVSGPPTPGIPLQNPNQARIKFAHEPSEMAKAPWEQAG
jgi:hypothetical protein